MQITFGQAFRAFRQQKGMSQRELARRSGVAVRTILYWEAGEHLPRIPELQTVLEILDATSEETARLTGLLTTPRGLRLVRAESITAEPPPGMGDLLRAMRLRRGMTQEDLARKLKVTRYSVVRWESMQNLINDENLVRLCELLRAAPEEQEALKTRRLPLPHWEVLDNRSVEELGQIWHDIHSSDSPLRDLYALGLKRHLLPLTATHEGARQLAVQIEHDHGIWLEFHERTQEAQGCIRNALHLMERCETSAGCWAGALNLATYYAFLSEKGTRSSIQIITHWLPRLTFGPVRVAQLCDMAIYVARSNASQQTASAWLAAAEQALDEIPAPQGWEYSYFQVSRARVGLMYGKHTASPEWLIEVSTNSFQRMNRLLMWSKELIIQKDLRLASHFLEKAQNLLTEQTPPKLRREFARLSYQL